MTASGSRIAGTEMVDTIACQRCGTKIPRRPGRGRQRVYCEECAPEAEKDARRRRFLQRYHVVDVYAAKCLTCGIEGGDHEDKVVLSIKKE